LVDSLSFTTIGLDWIGLDCMKNRQYKCFQQSFSYQQDEEELTVTVTVTLTLTASDGTKDLKIRLLYPPSRQE
jgi:hypothetical protein